MKRFGFALIAWLLIGAAGTAAAAGQAGVHLSIEFGVPRRYVRHYGDYRAHPQLAFWGPRYVVLLPRSVVIYHRRRYHHHHRRW